MPDRIKAVIKAKEGTTSYELLNFNRHFTSKFKYFSHELHYLLLLLQLFSLSILDFPYKLE